MSEYSDKLKNPKWQKIRLQVLERDEWCCQYCFDGESTERTWFYLASFPFWYCGRFAKHRIWGKSL
jgi:hypothetical protein